MVARATPALPNFTLPRPRRRNAPARGGVTGEIMPASSLRVPPAGHRHSLDLPAVVPSQSGLFTSAPPGPLWTRIIHKRFDRAAHCRLSATRRRRRHCFWPGVGSPAVARACSGRRWKTLGTASRKDRPKRGRRSRANNRCQGGGRVRPVPCRVIRPCRARIREAVVVVRARQVVQILVIPVRLRPRERIRWRCVLRRVR